MSMFLHRCVACHKVGLASAVCDRLLLADISAKNYGAPGFGCPGPFRGSGSEGPLKCSKGKCVSAKKRSKRAKLYKQCGGKGWKGPTKCVAEAVCKKQNAGYSQCVKKPNSSKLPGLWQQCGGKTFKGAQGKCAYGRPCVKINKWYSQCQRRK